MFEKIINFIKIIALIYLVGIFPSLFFGLDYGIVISVVTGSLIYAYKNREAYHKRREDYLKHHLIQSGWDESTIEKGLDRIDREIAGEDPNPF